MSPSSSAVSCCSQLCTPEQVACPGTALGTCPNRYLGFGVDLWDQCLDPKPGVSLELHLNIVWSMYVDYLLNLDDAVSFSSALK